ncbi:MAG: MBL fold metallo-hydrolase [Chloroflexi bacterium]|nr:MBL fold metallo-hydrolase [Chloroflexota bacterium]
MDIYWLGHSCFRIKGKSVTIVIDPYGPETGYNLPKLEANLVIVTHQHPGHSNVGAVSGEPKVVTGPGEYETSGVFITGVASFHDDKGGQLRGKNTVYRIEIDGLSLCHMGDLGHVLSSKTAGELGRVDVLLLPVGGVTTIDATGAAEVMRRLEPRIVVPMHYKTAVSRAELNGVDKFLKEVVVKEVAPQPRLSVSGINLPAALQVTVLEYPGSKVQAS